MNKQPTNSSDARYARTSITPSGYFGSDPGMIQEIQDIITLEEQQYVLDVMRKNDIWDVTESVFNENGNIIYDHRIWENRVATIDTIKKIDEKNGTDFEGLLNKIIERIRPVIEDFYNVEVYPTAPALVRWPEGAMQFPHADKELHEGPDAGMENNFPWYDLGTVFYFNDDYEGGELFFPKQNIEFKPKARAAYFFPGDKNFIHGVNKMTSGVRFTSPWFWTITNLKKDKDQ